MALVKKANVAGGSCAAELVSVGSLHHDADAEKKRARTLAKQQQAAERIAAASSELSSGVNEAV